ncbi:MAG TPA: glycerophosphodiester phosphodiesterase family protein [Sphingobium sp.]|nr:glycerophosphodiester phosphodiesterase family protein [Sphingobium sp.]
MAAAPRARRWLTGQSYAHRGLHGAGAPENSLAAFARAVQAGFGMECDVRAASDGVPHVFHDDRLERLTDGHGRFADRTSAEIATLGLADGSAVPSLAAMLRLVAGAVPILIEVKSGRASPAALCQVIAEELDHYAGSVAVMSFDPRVPAWFAARRRSVVRGLVLSRRGHPPAAVVRRHALAIARARPHFLACDVRDLPNRLATEARRRGMPLLCWTVRTNAERARVRRFADQLIFEQAGRFDG